ncbi:VanZ family protein [Clostridium novyi A str. NCTC 538]|nr:VanZ family protein [Clostridium novyi A str. NCTC 538]KEH84875.1 VanZ family protein [Clostridium novyi A str. 4540]KEH90520.1 VanZ family protein [Clostridium novyi A str. GD211209]
MRKILLWLTVIMWMGLIFKFSSQPAVQSNKLSTKVTSINVKAIEKVKPNTKFNIIEFHHMVRKNAHFFIYLVLGILTLSALRKSGVKGYKGIIFALLICFIYAISDEIHQTFVPGRSGMVKDVFIDTAGATVGILGYIISKYEK